MKGSNETLSVAKMAERMKEAEKTICTDDEQLEKCRRRRILFLSYAALSQIGKVTELSWLEVAKTISLPAEAVEAIRKSRKDPDFLTPEMLEWYNNFLLTGSKVILKK